MMRCISPISLYYLNQIGIIPWINKENYFNPIHLKQNEQTSAYKMAVFISPDLDNKARLLLDRIINYINLQKEELLLVELGSVDISAFDVPRLVRGTHFDLTQHTKIMHCTGSLDPSNKSQDVEVLQMNCQQPLMGSEKNNNLQEKWYYQLGQQAPAAILSLGINIHSVVRDLNLNSPVFNVMTLEELLNHPAAKKQVYETLNEINALFAKHN